MKVMLFILIIQSLISLVLGLRTSPDLKYANMAPSLVYQLISNGTEVRVLDKTTAVVSYAEGSLSDLLDSQKAASGLVLEACETDYYRDFCNETAEMQEEVEQKVLKIRFLKRNSSNLQESLSELANETARFTEEIDRKINHTEAKLSLERADLALIEEVEAMIREGLFNDTTENGTKSDEFIDSKIKRVNLIARRFTGFDERSRYITTQEIADEILNILSEIKGKLNAEITRLSLRRSRYLSRRIEEIEGFSKRTSDLEDKIEENEDFLAVQEIAKADLEGKIAGCELKRGEKERFCDRIRSNSSLFLAALTEASALLREVEGLLRY